MAKAMNKWLEDSLSTLERMELELHEHEAAVEAAMKSIRRHTVSIERLEKGIGIIRDALTRAQHMIEEVTDEASGVAIVVPERSTTARPNPPPLRPVAGPPPTPAKFATRR